MTPEGAVKKACEDLLKAERIPYWRMQSGRVWRGRGNNIVLNAPGTADLLAAPNRNHQKWDTFSEVPVFLWIETKRPKGKITPDQLIFADCMRNRGHYWLLVDDVKILQQWLAEHRAR